MPLACKLTLDRATHTMLAAYSQPDEELDALLAENKANMAARGDPRVNKLGDKALRHVAQVPMIVVELWKKLYGFDLMKYKHRHTDGGECERRLFKILNDPEWQKLKATQGRL